MRHFINKLLPFLTAISVGLILVGKLEFIDVNKIELMMSDAETLCYDNFENCKNIAEGTPYRTNRMVEPKYTAKALQSRVEGVIHLQVVFGAGGDVSSVTPLTTLPDGLTEESIKAARQIQFTPATIHGIPVSVVTEFEYVFTLNGPFAGIGKYRTVQKK